MRTTTQAAFPTLERKQKAEQRDKEQRMKEDEEEEARKASKHPKLNSYFTIKPATPNPTPSDG